jgi:hypothetical protein
VRNSEECKGITPRATMTELHFTIKLSCILASNILRIMPNLYPWKERQVEFFHLIFWFALSLWSPCIISFILSLVTHKEAKAHTGFAQGQLVDHGRNGTLSSLKSPYSSRHNWGQLEMQKGQRIEDKHAESWGQVCWALRWRHTTASLLLFHFSSLTLLLFSIL